jgi:hypothetical protein
MMTRPRHFLVLAALFVVAACGGGSPSVPGSTAAATSQAVGSTPPTTSSSSGAASTARPGGTGEACGLLTAAEIQELSGLQVDTMEARSAGGIYEDGCHLVLSNGGTVQAEVILGVLPKGGRAHYDDVLVPLAEGTGAEPLAGLGDAALVGSGGEAIATVVGDVLVDLQWIDLSSDPNDVPVALMQRILTNLAGT